jgi:hypothetical protein
MMPAEKRFPVNGHVMAGSFLRSAASRKCLATLPLVRGAYFIALIFRAVAAAQTIRTEQAPLAA